MQVRFLQLLCVALDTWDGKCDFLNYMMSFRSIHQVPVDKKLTKKVIKQLLNETVADVILNDERFQGRLSL